jgi:hypothetical protein
MSGCARDRYVLWFGSADEPGWTHGRGAYRALAHARWRHAVSGGTR